LKRIETLATGGGHCGSRDWSKAEEEATGRFKVKVTMSSSGREGTDIE